jgi:cyclopropane-fatty-acyl-phospholipid synthase
VKSIHLAGPSRVAQAHSIGEAAPSWMHRRVNALLNPAGVVLDGPRAWDPQIHRSRALRRVLMNGTLGAGEAYVDGDWDCEALDEFTARLCAAGADRRISWRSPASTAKALLARVGNRHGPGRARRDIPAHYDIGNDLYRAMLGPTMAYSCGYWRDADTLDEAQIAKHDLVCRKLALEPGMRVLDIGCGWAAFARHAAERHGVEVVGITLSPAQARLARERCAGLPVEIREEDYRSLSGRFDRVVSIGMFEHVGPPNYRRYFEIVSRVLDGRGLFLLHTIGGSRSARTTDPWIDRHVFPGSVLPSASQIAAAVEGTFVLEDWHNFGADYDRTLMAWHANVEAAWPALAGTYSERFRRLWRYYLLTCAGTFRAGQNHVWQLVLSPRGVRGGYRRIA